MRLIDADALKEYGTVIAIVNGKKMKVVSVRFIDNAPTVEERPNHFMNNGELIPLRTSLDINKMKGAEE